MITNLVIVIVLAALPIVLWPPILSVMGFRLGGVLRGLFSSPRLPLLHLVKSHYVQLQRYGTLLLCPRNKILADRTPIGSAAACAHSGIGNVAARSMFATLQSAGAGGAGAFVVIAQVSQIIGAALAAVFGLSTWFRSQT